MIAKIRLSPSQAETFELGLLLRDALPRYTEIETAYREAGPKRSAQVARSFVLDSLKVTNSLVRSGLRIEGRNLLRRSGDDRILELLATSSVPSPLTLAFFELFEVQSRRVAPLLRHDASGLGEGAYHFLRCYIRAGAAAAVQVLQETKLTEKAAAKRVADALNNCGFVNPRGEEQPYSLITIMDWRKGRKRRGSAKTNFDDHYQAWLLQLRGTVGRVEQARQRGQSWTVEQLRDIILFRLVNLAETFAYQV